MQSSATFLPKIIFPPFFGGHIFNALFILETAQDRAILTKYLARRVYAESSGTLSRKHFPAIFSGRLIFHINKKT